MEQNSTPQQHSRDFSTVLQQLRKFAFKAEGRLSGSPFQKLIAL